VDLAIARDGTIYFVTMEYDSQAHEGRHITVGVSKDQGARRGVGRGSPNTGSTIDPGLP